MQEHDMFFTNPVFHPGLNITVRNGDKWKKAEIGDTLLLKKRGTDHVIASATVMGHAFIPFPLIPKEWLLYEHDPACQNLGGLFAVISQSYPGFSMRNNVIIILFTV